MSIDFYGKISPVRPGWVTELVNARAFLELLELQPTEDLQGELSVHDARRAVMKARALFDLKVNKHTREEQEGHGARGARFFEGGLSRERLQEYLERFAALVEVYASAGCTHIYWA